MLRVRLTARDDSGTFPSTGIPLLLLLHSDRVRHVTYVTNQNSPRRLSMRALFLIALALLTITHIFLFAQYWPNSLIVPESLLSAPDSIPLVGCALGFSATTGLMTVWGLAKGKRLYLIPYIFIVGILAVVVLQHLPIGKLVVLSPSLPGLLGACVAFATGWALNSHTQNSTVKEPHQIAWLFFFLITLNFFLALAPLSNMVPTGIQENGSWALASFQLSNKDSVGIRDNLIFVAIRSLLTPLVGNSILINSLVSMVLCAFGIACLSKGINALCGKATALLATLFIVTEGWVLTAAYSANLTVTLIANAGLLFYIVVDALLNSRKASLKQSSIIIVMVLASCLLSLHSYAAVRIPWVLSIFVLSVTYLFSARGSLLTKLSAPLIRVLMPIAVALTLVLAIGYKGEFKALQKDLLVSWPKDSVVARPASGQIKDFVLIHNPDTPIWKQVARPANGDNVSLIWTRTPSETLRALIDHVGLILREHPETFFLTPLVFLLGVAAIFRLPLLERSQQIAALITCLWAIIWISSFLSVPDQVAYRRGIAFSAIAPVIAALTFAPGPSARGLTIAIPTLLGILFAVARLPDQLRFSNDPETRSRMFTVCGNAFAVRTLLATGSKSSVPMGPLQVALVGAQNPREANCLSTAAKSNEWQRIFPGSDIIGDGSKTNIVDAVKTPGSNTTLLYCSPDSMREPTVKAICKGELPSIRIIDSIPVVYGGVSDTWVTFTGIDTKK